MARETGRGGDRNSKDSGSKGERDNKKKSTKKSGWSKPDGTPLRKRKGDYFPDKEIDKRKPAARSKYAKEGSPRDFDKPREYKRSEGDSTPRSYDKTGDFRKSGSSFRDRDNDKPRESRTERPSRERDDKPREYRKPEGRDSDKPRGDRSFRDRDEKHREYKKYEGTRDRDSDKPREYKRAEEGSRDRDDKPREFKRDDRGSDDRTEKRDYKKSGSNYGDYKRAGNSRDRDDKPREYTKRDDSAPDSEERKSRVISKPAFERKGKKPFEKKRERYADKDHSKEMRGRFDKDRNKPKERRSAAGPHRERKSKSADPDTKDAIRLNRYIANAGICSRREADELITAGLVSINGEIITELGTKVKPGDVVKFNDQTLKTEKLVYVLLNKPKDFLTTTDDPEERKTVMSLVKDAGKERIFPVGRLDRNTTGLLLLTNDGELTKRLTHPSGNIKKLYQVELDKNLTQADMLRAAEGIELEDGIIAVDEIQYASPDDKSIVGVELHSGKNRIVRRIFEAMGYEVRKLDRTTFAGLTKKDLPRGRWRFLTEMELNMLKMLTGKKK